jgi:hypothetical protein
MHPDSDVLGTEALGKASVSIALNEYNKSWEYYNKITDFWNQYVGNFYKAASLFSAVVSAIVTWAASDYGGPQAKLVFPYLAIGGALSLWVLTAVGWFSSRMMATEIANSHLYLSHLASLRRYLFQETGLQGVLPLHIVRDGIERAHERVDRIDALAKRVHTAGGIQTNDRIKTLYLISAAVATFSLVIFLLGVFSLIPSSVGMPLVGALATLLPALSFVPAYALTLLGTLVAVVGVVAFWLAVIRMFEGMARKRYVDYLNGKIDVPEEEMGDNYFQTRTILARPGYEKPAGK